MLVAPVGATSLVFSALVIMTWTRRFTRYVSVALHPRPPSSTPNPPLLPGPLDHPSFTHDILHPTLHQQHIEDFFKKLTVEEAMAREEQGAGPVLEQEELEQARECCRKLAVWGGLWSALSLEEVRTFPTPLVILSRPPSGPTLDASMKFSCTNPPLRIPPGLSSGPMIISRMVLPPSIHTLTHIALRFQCQS